MLRGPVSLVRTRCEDSHLNRLLRFALAAACTAASLLPAAARAQIAPESVVLHPGDMVQITVWRHPEFSGEFPIDATGAISHPLFRTIHVAGVPLATAESELRAYLQKYDAEPAFTFVPLLRIYVLGEVRQPNTLTVPAGTTIAQAIALAGGPTDAAELARVTMVRDSATTVLNFTRPDIAMGRLAVHSGDEILVPKATSFWRDDLAPIASLVAAAVSIANLVRR